MSTWARAMTTPGWDPQVIQSLLTRERLAGYLQDCQGDLASALTLYEWNAHAAAAVMTTTGLVEVVVRNAIDKSLVSWAAVRHPNQSWFDAVGLDAQGEKGLSKARSRVRHPRSHAEDHGKVIAELSFGFWRYLVASRYLTALWIPALHEAFPGGHPDLGIRRRQVDQRLQSLLYVRNRAAHHEPIHRRNLEKDLAAASELLQWISVDAQRWATEISPLRRVALERPTRSSGDWS
jgi:hypothetical protein